jgi:hypothetical protein
VKLRGFSVIYDFFEGYVFMKPNMIKKWSIALLVAAGAAGLTGCEGMRVDEGASTATNSGNIEDRNVLKANLSGTVVDDFGAGLADVTVYAYGQSTTTDAGGNWIMKNVPVTGVTVNSTPQNLEQTTDIASSGSIYVTYNKGGYAEYKSQISNPAVITHYGTAGGNPNSIVVDGLVASEAVQLPQLVNTVTGVLIDRGSYYSDPVTEYDMASGLTVRLVPAIDVVNNAYGSAAQTGAGATECYEGCGFYSVSEMVSTTDANGIFTFTSVPKIPGGYILRVDDAGYRPIDRPNDGTGYSYDYDQGPLDTALNAGNALWTVTTQSTLDPAQNYWWGIDFDVKTTGTVTFLEDLYVGDYLVADENVVEGITVGAKYGYPDEDSGEAGHDDGHNADITFDNENQQEIDANLVDLGIVPLKFIFSGDMVPYAAGELPARALVVFDSTGAQLGWDADKTSISGRTLTLQLASTPTVGTSIYVRLHKDVFTDMSGQRLFQTVDPNQADYSNAAAGADEADIAEIVNNDGVAQAKPFYAEYEIVYSDPLIVPDPVEDFAQANIGVNSLGIQATSLLTDPGAATASLSALQGSDFRIEELLDAMLERVVTDGGAGSIVANIDGVGNAAAPGNALTFTDSLAVVEFKAVNGAIYRLRVRDVDGVVLTTMSTPTAQLNDVDLEDGTVGVTVATGATQNVPASGVDNIGTTFLDFRADVGSGTTALAKVNLTGVAAGYTVSIVRLNDFGDEVASSAVTKTLVDNFMPHVAIQNSNNNGQDTQFQGDGLYSAGAASLSSADTAQMLFSCGIEKSDDNGEAEVGEFAYYFPKLNLSASLYDKSNLRAHSEVGGALSTAMDQNVSTATFTSAEDGNPLIASLAVNARNTPLIATTAATEAKAGTTESGRNDQYYTAGDYDAWGLIAATSATPDCQYYMADLNNITGVYEGAWTPANLVGSTWTPISGGVAVADDDNDQDTIPPALDNYSLSTTYSFTTVGGTTVTGNVILEQQSLTACSTPGTGVYDFDRTVVLNMTEEVIAPADLAVFKDTAATCGQNNVDADSEVYSNLIGIAAQTEGWNKDHLLLTFNDWREIDDSDHWQDNTEDANADPIANSIGDGSALADLVQIVGVTDTSGVAATAGNGRGVLLVDATPPLATSMVNSSGNNVVITFDQTVSTGDNGEIDNDNLNGGAAYDSEFEIAGDGVVYTFNYAVTTSAEAPAGGRTAAWTVRRDTNYVDPFGSTVTANTRLDITLTADNNTDLNVPQNVANSRFSITVADPSTTSGDNANGTIDYRDFFSELSHTSANSVAAATGTTPDYYLDYPDLEDNNFNSWAMVEPYDVYDDSGTPRLVGADALGPRLLSVRNDADGDNDFLENADIDPDSAFLLLDDVANNDFTIDGIHVTDDADSDSIYSPVAVGAAGTNYGLTAGTATQDTELAYEWGVTSGTIAANVPDGDEQVVLKLSVNDADITQAFSYIYRPAVGELDDINGGVTAINGNVVIGTTATAAANVTSRSGTIAGNVGLRNTDAANGTNDTIVVTLPAGLAGVSSTDKLVIQNVRVNGRFYTIMVPAPTAVESTTQSSRTEPTGVSLSAEIYKHVYLEDSNLVGEIRTSSDFGQDAVATGSFLFPDAAIGTSTPRFLFREDIKEATATWIADGVDDDTDVITAGVTATATDQVVSFTGTASKVTGTAHAIDVQLDPVASGSVSETTRKFVGRGAQLQVTATDFSNQSSSFVITFQKGHAGTSFDIDASGGATDDEQVILNLISGTAVK